VQLIGTKVELSDKLRLLRKETGWTQAIAAKTIAIQQSYLSKLESGHYQPSSDVIEKLCLAYNVKEHYLIEQPRRKYSVAGHLLLGTVFAAVLALVVVINGYFGLIFPHTYYTYKAQAITQVSEPKLTLDYHLTDIYQGDKYISEFSNIKYEYSLVATRDVNRKENRWLMSIGSLVLFSSLSLCIYLLARKRKAFE
jgi:transcriptional regulator with XRE-family HTH domain